MMSIGQEDPGGGAVRVWVRVRADRMMKEKVGKRNRQYSKDKTFRFEVERSRRVAGDGPGLAGAAGCPEQIFTLDNSVCLA